jgi:hypothetical protein
MFPETEGPKDKEKGTTESPECSEASEIQPGSNGEGKRGKGKTWCL